MKYINLSLNEFLDSDRKTLINQYISYINDYNDDLSLFLNHFIAEELNWKIPRNQDNDTIVNILDSSHPTYSDISPYSTDTENTYLDKFYGFDSFDDETELFFNTYKESFTEWIYYWLDQKLEETLLEIFDNFEEDNIIIYRGMGLDTDFE